MKNRLGEEGINNDGFKMRIVKYENCNDLDVEFLNDGCIRKHVKYGNFKNGKVKHPNFKSRPYRIKNNRVGEKNYNNFGSEMIIKEYRGAKDIDVYFPEYNWTFEHASYDSFKLGKIKCPDEGYVFNKGYLGKGKYKKYKNGKATKCYRTWVHMLERCYSSRYHKTHPSYIGCEVCEEWLNFQNFATWFYKHYYEIPGELMCLDKDILIKGNRIYSPETCVIVPNKINMIFVKNNKNRGELPIGVRFNGVSYVCELNDDNKPYKGSYKTIEEAFQCYKSLKEKYIKQVADEYKEYIPEEVYEAMYKWEVEITD